MTTPVEHSSRGPSTWERWVRCTGAPAAEAEHPNISGYEASQGTFFHEIVAACLILGFDAEDEIGTRLVIDDTLFTFDQKMADHAREGLQYVRSVAASEGWELFVETRVDISPWTLPGEFGTADVILVNIERRLIIVFDWKYGQEPVYAAENYQLRGYCLGAWQTLCGEQFGWDPSDIKVTLVIEQPRAPGAGGAWETTMERVLEFGAHARRQAAISQRENAPRTPGPKQCKWCRARNVCGPRAAWHVEAIGLDFDDLDTAFEVNEAPELVEGLSAAGRSYLIAIAPQIKTWLDELRAAAERDAKKGLPVPGFAMVDGRRSARSWRENQKHKAAIALTNLIGKDAYTPPQLLTPSAAQEKVGKARYKTHLESFVTPGSRKPTLVPDADTRKRKPSITDEFED